MPEAAVSSGLWESILKEVDTETRVPDKTVLLLGRPGIGKRTLIQALLAHACPAAAADAGADDNNSRSVCLDYAYFGARDPEHDEASTAPDYVCPAACSVLILEDARHEKVLRSRLTPDCLKHCAAVICLDLKLPWKMMEDLRQWFELLQRLTSELLQLLPLGEQDQLREKLVSAVSDYTEPGAPENAAGESGGAALVYNMGIPVVVVVTRADGASALETQKTVGWSETIEAYLRNECLSYGAALIYTMIQAKNARNVDVVFNYLMHRLYGYTLKNKPVVPSRDALFIPSGWDTQTKVDQAAAALPGGGLDRSFESVVISLESPEGAAPPPDECEDMQHFLKRNAVVLQKLGGGSAASARKLPGGGGAEGGGGAAPDKERRGSTSSQGGARRGSKSEGQGGGPPGTDNSSLANFFQNLLTRGQSGSAPPGTNPGVPGVPNAGAAPAPGAVPAVTVTAPGSTPTANGAGKEGDLPAAAEPPAAAPAAAAGGGGEAAAAPKEAAAPAAGAA